MNLFHHAKSLAWIILLPCCDDRYVMTASTPPALSDKYLGGTRHATHATDFVMLFHYSADDTAEYNSTKGMFRDIIKDFMVTGNVSSWDVFPAVYNISSHSVNRTSSWTIDSCDKWKNIFYPEYSWMNWFIVPRHADRDGQWFQDCVRLFGGLSQWIAT